MTRRTIVKTLADMRKLFLAILLLAGIRALEL